MTTVQNGNASFSQNDNQTLNESTSEQRREDLIATGSTRLEDELAEILENPQPPQSTQQPQRSPQSELPQEPSASPKQTAEQEASATSTPFITKIFNSESIALARKLGYGLLILSAIDFIFLLIPPQFLNPVWEYKVIGDIVKLVPLPMFALLLIFAGERTNRKRIEKLPLKILSWLSLVIAIFFFLLLPLIITDYVRINQFNNNQISSEVNLQKKKLAATQEQVEQMNSQEVENLVPRRDEDGTLGQLPETPQEARENILNNLERAKDQADERALTARNNVTLNLVKNSVKLFLQSLLAGVLFVMVWLSTKWARISKTKKKRKVRKS